MPVNTPTVKVVNTRRHGAEVILTGETVEEAAAFAHAHGREHGLTFIHPYDDPLVIAGQGTLALEMLGAAPEIDTLRRADRRRRADLRHRRGRQGPQARHPPDRRAGRSSIPPCTTPSTARSLPMRGDTLAEGIAVKAPGRITQAIVRELVDDIVLVTEQEIERAVSLLINIEKTVVEGAGAAGLAAVLKLRRTRFKGRMLGLVLCGGNIDTRLLASVLTRELAREGRLTQLDHRPGRPAGPAGQGRQPAGRGRRQHRRGLPPAHLLRPAGQGGAARAGDRDARPRAPERDGRRAQGCGLRGGGAQQPRRSALRP